MRDTLKWIVFVAAVTLIQFAYIYAFFIEPNWINIERVKIADPKLAKVLSGIKIVQISDLHLEAMGFKEISLIEKINRIKPDLIFVTGDMIETEQGVPVLWNILNLLEPKIRTYIVHGEADSAVLELKDSQNWDKSKTTLLDNKAIRMDIKNGQDTAFWLLGAYLPEELDSLLSEIKRDHMPVLLLTHRPDMIKSAAVAKINMVFCGHTHGGQVRLPFAAKIMAYADKSPYVAGLYRVQNSLLYVNSGIASKKGIRLFRRPEITLFEFAAEGKSTLPEVLEQDIIN